jgi:hypothetical protein
MKAVESAGAVLVVMDGRDGGRFFGRKPGYGERIELAQGRVQWLHCAPLDSITKYLEQTRSRV